MRKIRQLDLEQSRVFSLGDKVSEQPISLIKNTDLITNKKGNERQIHPGRCYEFTTAEHVVISDVDDYSFTDGSGTDLPFSVSAWIYIDNTTSYKPVIGKDGTSSGNREWSLNYYSSTNTLNFNLFKSDNTANIGRVGPDLTALVWMHVAATYDGTEASSGMRIYVNGIRVDASDNNSGTYEGMSNTSQDVHLGRLGSFYTDGKMFDVRIHDKELTASEVVEVMNGRPSGFEIGWWKCEEGGGDISYDSSGNGHHGTITNATLSTFHTTNTGIPYSFLNNVGYTPVSWTDGSDGYYLGEYEYYTNLNPRTDDYTIEAWFYAGNSGEADIASILSKGGGAPTNPGYWWYLSTTNQLAVRHANGTTQYQITTGALSTGWHYAAMVVDRDAYVYCYIDGVQTSNPTSIIDGVDINPTYDLRIHEYYGGTYTQNGAVGSVRWTRRALTYEEVRDAYFNGFTEDDDTEAIFYVDSTGHRVESVNSKYLYSDLVDIVYLPRNEFNIAKDVAGSPLLYSGVVKYNTELTSTCCSFDGTDDNIVCTDSDDFSFDGDVPFSASVWVNIDSLGTYRPFVLKDGVTSGLREWSMGVDSADDRLYFTCFHSDSSALIRTKAVIPPTGEWIHVCGTYDGSESENGMKMYLNGERVDKTPSSTGTYTGMTNTSQPVTIGKLSAWDIAGDMCDVRIFNVELTVDEVQSVMAGEANGNEVGWWTLSEGQGDMVYDVVGNNHGVISAGTLSTIWTTQNVFNYNLKGFSDAAYFDETAYYTIPFNSALVPGTDPFTIESTICIADYADGTIASIYSQTTSSSDRLWFYINTDGKLKIVADNSSNIITAETSANPFTDGQIHYIAVSVDPGNSVKFYCDGVIVGSTTTTNTGESIDPAADHYIGQYTGTTHLLLGEMFNFRFSNKARSDGDIWNTYTNGMSVDDSTVVYYDFKNGEAVDLSGNGIDGTGTNTEALKVPVNIDLLTDPSGQPVDRLGGRWNNGAVSIDFTGGVSSPRMNNIYSGYASFNGSSDYIEVPHDDLLSFTTDSHDLPFSVSAWVNCADILSTPFVGVYDGTNSEWLICTEANGYLRIALKDDSSGGLLMASSTTALQTDQWIHVAGTYTGEAGIPEETVAVSNYETSSSYEITAITLRDGNVFIIWYDVYDSNYGYYCIIEPDGTEVKAPTVFNSDDCSYFGMCQLDNGNVYIAFRNGVGGSYAGKYVIISSTGTIITSSTAIPTIATNSGSFKPVLLDNGNIMLCYSDNTTGNDGSLAIFDEDGAYVSGVTVFDSTVSFLNMIKLNNGNMLIVYRDGTDLSYVIYDQGGTLVRKAVTSIVTDAVGDIHVDSFKNGNVLIVYCNASLTKYCVLDQGGAVVKAVTTIDATGAGYYPCIARHENGNCVVVYQDPVDSDMNAFVVDDEGEIVHSPYNISGEDAWDSYIVPLHDGTHMCLYSDPSEYGAYIAYDFRYAQDPSYENIKLYLNGEELTTSDDSSGTYECMENIDSPLWIGRYSTVYAEEFIRDVYIYDRVLTATEIKKLYKTGSGIDRDSIVANYKLYKNAYDSSTNRLHGELKSTVSFPTLTIPAAYDFGDSLNEPMYKKVIGEPTIESTGSGVIYAKSNTAYGIWEFDFNKDTDVNYINIYFISSLNSISSTDAYVWQFTTTEAIYLWRIIGGSDSLLCGSSASYLDYSKWYSAKIVRNSVANEYVNGAVGTFALYIDGVLVTASSGSNPVTDNTHTSSLYIIISNVSSNQKIKNLKINGSLVNLSTFQGDLSSYNLIGDKESNYTIFERPLISPAAIRPVHRYTKTESI